MNIFCFAGNLVRDPELRMIQTGKSVCSFTVALKKGDKATFIDCVAWGKAGEIINEYCKKGERISGSGELVNRKWEKDGQTHYKIECVIDKFDLPPKKLEDQQVSNTYEDDIPF